MSDTETTDRPKEPFFSEQDRKNIAWFWNNYLKSKSPWLLLVLGMVLVQAFAYQQFLSLTETGLRVIFDHGAIADLVQICGLVFLLFALRGTVSYLTPRLSASLASDAVLRMRQDLITHLLSLDLNFFERTSSGEIILRVVNQAQDLSLFVGQATVNAVRDATTIIVVSAYLIYKSPLLFTSALIAFPIIIYMMQKVSEHIKRIQANAENAMGAYMSGLEEMTNGMRTVKISSQEEQEKIRLFEATEGIKSLSINLQAAQATVLPAIDFVSAFVYTLVIGGGGYLALSGTSDMDGAGVISFLLGMVLVFDPARLLAQFVARLQAHLVLLDGICSLYREVPQIQDKRTSDEDFDPQGDLILKGVTFGYHPETPLFDKLNLRLEGGKITAIVGATGSGKTTVLSLLTRLYQVQGGQITIGGKPIDDIKIKSLRRAFSVVSQDIVIFNSSIWDNIKYVRPDATDSEIWAAAEAAEIAELIRTRGDSNLGPKGSQLSGGQKQRIAIARAFLRSAPILLLDEATSALDQKTEDKVQRALARLSRGKTTIIVSHRLSSITQADQIFVLDNGQVLEAGSHADLITQKGQYFAMYSSQKRGYE